MIGTQYNEVPLGWVADFLEVVLAVETDTAKLGIDLIDGGIHVAPEGSDEAPNWTSLALISLWLMDLM